VDQLGLVQLSTVKAYREALQSSGPEYADAKRAKDHLDTNKGAAVPDEINAKLLKAGLIGG